MAYKPLVIPEHSLTHVGDDWTAEVWYSEWGGYSLEEFKFLDVRVDIDELPHRMRDAIIHRVKEFNE